MSEDKEEIYFGLPRIEGLCLKYFVTNTFANPQSHYLNP